MEKGEAVQDLIDHFGRYVETGPEVRRTITSYVERYSRSGVFEQRATAWQGFMLWAVTGTESTGREEGG
jgi:hypothetical protein